MTEHSPLPVIEMRNITKVFPGVQALKEVNFSVFSREIRGLVGKNGAGKSTLMHVLTGIYPANSGEILVDNHPIPNMSTTIAKERGISFVHQHSQLIPSLSMAENIYCGNLPKTKFGLVNWGKLYNDAQEHITQLGLNLDIRRPIEGASVAEKQIIEIIKAMFSNPKVIILDEATAPLPKSEVEMLFKFVRRLRDQGVAFIYISHYLEEVFALCDSVTVLRDGMKIGDYKVGELNQKELINLISGVKLEKYERIGGAKKSVKPVLEIQKLSRDNNYYDLNLKFHSGEVVGITGLDGCGKDSLARGLFGLEPLGQGEVYLNGKPLSVREPKDGFSQGIAYLPRDRHGFGIIGIRPVRENVTLPNLKKLLNKLGLLKLDEEKKFVLKIIDQLNIVTPSQEQPVQFLSGGNQQKVVFAKLVGVRPKVLFLDEPTQGVDVQAKVEIMKIIDELSRNNICVIVISEELRELLDLCDRIIVMYQGRVQREFAVSDPDTSVANIMAAIEGA